MSDDSDSSSSSSSSSRSSSGRRRRSPPPPDGDHSSTSAAATAAGDPDSPGAARHLSSDESTSSDGVLVELPSAQDHDLRSSTVESHGDCGVLVDMSEDNFVDASEDLASGSVGPTPRHARGGGGNDLGESVAVLEFGEGSVTRSHDIDHLQARLDDALVKCRQHKEERELFAAEVINLHRQLQEMVEQQPRNGQASGHLQVIESEEAEEHALSSPTPLHLMLDDCSKSMTQLRGIMEEQLSLGSTVKELQALLHGKDQEIEDLHARVLQMTMSHNVFASYIRSIKDVSVESQREYDVVSRRLLASISSVIGQEDSSFDCHNDLISKVEMQTLKLIERHTALLSYIQQVRQCLEEVSPNSLALETSDFGSFLDIALQELIERKNKETDYQERFYQLEEENRKLVEELEKMKVSLDESNSETNKSKAELEQADAKLAAAKEKLSIAVSKGKSLVQHRDSLKQALAEKTSELEKYMLELQNKSEALEASEIRVQELKMSLEEKTSELENCLHQLYQKSESFSDVEARVDELNQSLEKKSGELENCLQELQQKSFALEAAEARSKELNDMQDLLNSLHVSVYNRDKVFQDIEEIIAHANSSEELLSLGIVDRVKWLVDQNSNSQSILVENNKIKNTLSSIELPGNISSLDLESQISCLGSSLCQTRDEVVKLQQEVAATQGALSSHELEFSEAKKEIDRLAASLLEERQGKDIFRDEANQWRSQFEEISENFSAVSIQKDGLMKILMEITGSSLDNQSSTDIEIMKEKYMQSMKEKTTSLIGTEQFEKMQAFLYITHQEFALCEEILEEEVLNRSEMVNVANELHRVSEELASLRNEKESLQKELERSEEKSSLIREKLSMAVKKGKGLVQEREGFKISLDEKNSEIQKLKHKLQLQDSAIAEYKEQIFACQEQLQKLEANITSLKDEKDQFEQIASESNSKLEMVINSISQISIGSFEDPVEKSNQIAEYIHEMKLDKAALENELQKAKEEAILSMSKLEEAGATIKMLEDELSECKRLVFVFSEEAKETQLGRASLEQELEIMKEENATLASNLEQAYKTAKSLEDTLLQSNNNLSLLCAEKSELESKIKHETDILNAKLVECMKELDLTRASLRGQSIEAADYLTDLVKFFMDEGLSPFMSKDFHRKMVDLKNMGLLIQSMHEILMKYGDVDPGLEEGPQIESIVAFPNVEDYVGDKIVQVDTWSTDPDEGPSLLKITEELKAQAKLLIDGFKSLSKYLDDFAAAACQALQVARDQALHILDLNESLKLNISTLEGHKQAHEDKILSLQKENESLLSACTSTTEALQNYIHDLLDLVPPTEGDAAKTNQGDANVYLEAAESLLISASRIRNHFEQLVNEKRASMSYVKELQDKLKQAQLTAETTVRDNHLSQCKVSKLEEDLEALNNVCNEHKVKIDGYQAKENVVQEMEAELMSLRSNLIKKDEVTGDKLLSEDELENLMDKVKNFEIPFKELEGDSEVNFSSATDKLLYIIDKAYELQNRIFKMVQEKEDMQLILASHESEIENLKKTAETLSTYNQDYELKKEELTNLTSGLDRLIQRFGGNDQLEGMKVITVREILQILERLVTTLSTECEHSKSKVQELGAKLHAKEMLIDELSAKVELLEDSVKAMVPQSDTGKERGHFESSAAMSSEISEVEDVEPLAKNPVSAVPAAAHARTTRKGSTDHLVLDIDTGSEKLLTSYESDDKGHVFKTLNTSGLIPKQGKLVADRIDGIWVAGGRMLMNRPRARLGLIAYWLLVHLWVLGTIL